MTLTTLVALVVVGLLVLLVARRLARRRRRPRGDHDLQMWLTTRTGTDYDWQQAQSEYVAALRRGRRG